MKLAVIPARGGSKRIPRKNIRDFCGKPIIAYSIDIALQSGLFDRVMVSTDDAEIAEVAEACGADIPFLRPAELADDFTGTNAIARHAIEWHHEHGQHVDYACCLYATAPLLQTGDLQRGFEQLRQQQADFAFAITHYDFPIQRALRQCEDQRVTAFDPHAMSSRSQDLEEAWHDAGQFYWGRAQAFLDELPMMNGNAIGIPVPRYRVQDIDTEEDWRQAELMFQALARAD